MSAGAAHWRPRHEATAANTVECVELLGEREREEARVVAGHERTHGVGAEVERAEQELLPFWLCGDGQRLKNMTCGARVLVRGGRSQRQGRLFYLSLLTQIRVDIGADVPRKHKW